MTVTTSKLKAMERYQRFLDDGMRADETMQQSGLGYDAKDVHAFMLAKARGKKARRPKAIRWRK